jgi:uncharacterized protein (DUF2141 family)
LKIEIKNAQATMAEELVKIEVASKECDIMTNALQALQNQDGKWATKVMHSTKHFSASLLLNRV